MACTCFLNSFISDFYRIHTSFNHKKWNRLLFLRSREFVFTQDESLLRNTRYGLIMRNDFTDETLPQVLKWWIEHEGDTYGSLSVELDTSAANISRWISHGVQPSPRFYDGLCDYMEITRSELGLLILNTNLARESRRSL